MTPFTADLAITLSLWAALFGLSWLLVRVGGILWAMPRVRKYLKRVFYIIAAVVVLLLGSADPESRAAHVAVVLALILFAPIAILIFIQFAFWTYHALKHGNPFYEREDHPDAPEDNDRPDFYHGEKRQKKYCPICKRNSGCRIGRGRSGISFHVVR